MKLEDSDNYPTRDALQWRQLIHDAKHGSDEAFSALTEAFMPLMLKLGYLYKTPGIEMDDFRQEGRISLYRAIQRFDENQGIPFPAYASRCIQNALIDFSRRNLRTKNRMLDCAERSEDAVQAAFSREQKHIDIENQLIGRLDEMDRLAAMKQIMQAVCSDLEQAVLIRYLTDERPAEIAAHLQCTPLQVQNALYRARKKMRLALEEREVERQNKKKRKA